MTETARLRRVTLRCPQESLAGMLAALDDFDVSLAEEGDFWRIAVYAADAGAVAQAVAALSVAALVGGVRDARPMVEDVPQRDWAAEAGAAFPPVTAGRFYIHGSHHEGAPAGSLPIVLDAGRAFGTGAHETTRGCLIAIDRLARRLRPARTLDLGTGSGILAIAAWKAWHGFVAAADNDPVAVTVARDNARRNRARLHLFVSDGVRRKALRVAGPYDLILANILARPLERLAPGLARLAAPGGWVVLSGLLVAQERQVLAAYRRCGMRLRGRVRLAEWSTLLLDRHAGPKTA